jgi:hypothetical protein
VAVDIRPGTAPDHYNLRVAVYDRSNKEPLPIALDAAKGAPTSAVMGSIVVVSSPRQPEAAKLSIEERQEVQLTSELGLLGWSLDRKVARFGEAMTVSLFWRATAQPLDDYKARIQVLGPDGRAWAQGDFSLAGADYPPTRWSAGETIERPYDLRLDEDAPATDARVTLTLLDGKGQSVARPVELGALRIEGHYFSPPTIGHRQEASLGEQIALLGYDLDASEVRPGEMVALTLYWRARAPIRGQYKVFVHLLGADGKLWGQKDAMPLDGYYRTERWRTDEVIVDRYGIPLAADAPAGRYHLAIGMYNPAAEGRRLSLRDGQDAPQPDDRLLLDTEIVAP